MGRLERFRRFVAPVRGTCDLMSCRTPVRAWEFQMQGSSVISEHLFFRRVPHASHKPAEQTLRPQTGHPGSTLDLLCRMLLAGRVQPFSVHIRVCERVRGKLFDALGQHFPITRSDLQALCKLCKQARVAGVCCNTR